MVPALLGLLIAVSLPAQPPAAGAPVQINGAQLRALSIDINRGTWEAELVNTGSRTITAWIIGMGTRLPNGQLQHGGSTGADHLMNVPFNDQERRRMRDSGFNAFPLEPGESAPLQRNHFRSTGMDGQPLPFEVELRAVIYEDGSVEGDPKAAAGILQSRRASLACAEKYVPAILATRDSDNPTEALKAIYQDVTAQLHEFDKDPEKPQNIESMRARGPLNQTQMEVRNLIQAAQRRDFFLQQLTRLEARFERLKSGVR
jgi:hypothetical protein